MNTIVLKYGRVRRLELCDSFVNNHKLLHDYITTLAHYMHDNGWNLSCRNYTIGDPLDISDKRDIVRRLCDALDAFFDLGVEIYNDWECRLHETKEDYAKYLYDYVNEGSAA